MKVFISTYRYKLKIKSKYVEDKMKAIITTHIYPIIDRYITFVILCHGQMCILFSFCLHKCVCPQYEKKIEIDENKTF